ncbi:LOW QUALITY PROTEIN: adiponectin receptor protein 1-like [Molossus nigricans]
MRHLKCLDPAASWSPSSRPGSPAGRARAPPTCLVLAGLAQSHSSSGSLQRGGSARLCFRPPSVLLLQPELLSLPRNCSSRDSGELAYRSSHKGPVVGQGIGAPANNRETDTVEQAELGPLLEEKTKRGIADPTKAEGEQACPGPQEEEEEVRVLTLPLQAHHVMEKMEEFVYKAWEGRWRVIPYDVLPELQDNDYLLNGHRPPMPSFWACFKSIFHIHIETGNIWTHLLGFVLFLFLGILTTLRPNMYFMAPLEKVVFGMFFLGAVLCLSFSWLFHTVYCHSEKVSRTFSKLDCSGIALLILGSFVPWLYYSFYRSPQPRLIYLSIICVLGISAIIVAQWDGFAPPKHRQTQAGVFLGLGLSGVVPTMHFTIAEGFVKATTVGQMGWFFLMAVMYITRDGLYAARIPERFFPGKFDIWFQSHQLFHVLMVAAAFVHFNGVSNFQEFCYGLEGSCSDDSPL